MRLLQHLVLGLVAWLVVACSTGVGDFSSPPAAGTGHVSGQEICPDKAAYADQPVYLLRVDKTYQVVREGRTDGDGRWIFNNVSVGTYLGWAGPRPSGEIGVWPDSPREVRPDRVTDFGRSLRRACEFVEAPKPRSMPREEISRLIGELTHCEGAQCRVEAAAALSAVRDPRAVEALNRALSDRNDRVRGDVAKVLGDRFVRSAVPALIQRLDAENLDWVTVSVVRALARLGDHDAMAPLVRLARRTESDYVRSQVTWALKHFGKPSMFTER